MKSAPFDYVRPVGVAEAIAALRQEDKTVSLLAGGQSLLVLLSLRIAPVDLLVDIGRIEELKRVSESATHVFLGAATTHAMIEDGAVPDPSRGLMPRVASALAYRAIRNHGTIGGSVALADPAADWPACLMALNATAVIRGPAGERREAVTDFVQGMYTTTLQQGEIILGFDIPRLPEGTRWGAAKVTRKSGAFASSMAFVIERGEGAPARVILGATASHPQPMPAVADYLSQHTTIDETEMRTAIGADLDGVDPEADAYQRRNHTATVLRAIREAHA
ncbi:MAG TPA: FAD binding domain-containing protein [Bradyrhizobium sp.]|jgi:carbon-monoxide dehydrogenase medium subunit